MEKMSKLTIKQEKFCNKYVECGNASEAYRFAYDCSKMKEKSVNENASVMFNNAKIAARVDELKNELKNKSDITKERLLEELSKIAFSSIAHLHNSWIERVEFDLLTNDQKACIKNISTKILKRNIGTNECPEIVDVEYVKIELYDKIKAIDSISKMLGFDAPVKLEHSGAITWNEEKTYEAKPQADDGY